MRAVGLSVSVVVAGVAVSASAADLTVAVETPRIAVAGYNRPYVAAWVERPDQSDARTLFVWYDTAQPAGQGRDWLRDLRTWWRREGRALGRAVDGVSSATRPPGRHAVKVPAARLRDLAAGDYVLAVEAARELGGREMVRVPFRWGAPNAASVSGTGELGVVRVVVSR